MERKIMQDDDSRVSTPSWPSSSQSRRSSSDSGQTATFVGSYRVKRKKFSAYSTESQPAHGRGQYRPTLMSQLSKGVPGYYEFLKPTSVFLKPMRKEPAVPKAFCDSYKIQHPELSSGEKEYLWHTASVYSMTNMQKHVQQRFLQKLQHQMDIGCLTPEEFEKYYQYITKPRKRQYDADPNVWRKPPKIEPRPKYFHKRHATAPPGFTNSYNSTEKVTAPRRVHVRSASAQSLHTSMKGLSLYYDPAIKRTLQGGKKKEPPP